MDTKEVVRLMTENQMEKLCEPGTLTGKVFDIMMGSINPWLAMRRAIQYDNLLRGAKRMRDMFKAERRRADEAVQELDELRIRLKAVESVMGSGIWVWADTSDDDLASMGDEMVLTLTAGQLRNMLSNHGAGNCNV